MKQLFHSRLLDMKWLQPTPRYAPLWLSIISYPTRARGIIVEYTWKNRLERTKEDKTICCKRHTTVLPANKHWDDFSSVLHNNAMYDVWSLLTWNLHPTGICDSCLIFHWQLPSWCSQVSNKHVDDVSSGGRRKSLLKFHCCTHSDAQYPLYLGRNLSLCSIFGSHDANFLR